ncbi:MAG: Cof-type HAD-IIB family hydrolase [Clostridiaceae bacterium]|nr:Cof-type HAD-IIB family hydrolase [Clostridiaceae bacterium]
MTYRLLVLDLDGTLLRQDKSVSDANRQSIRLARQNGVRVVLATGRPPVGTRAIQKALGPECDEYLIAFNGALIQNQHTGAVLSRHHLSRTDYDLLAPLVHSLGLFCYAFTQDTCLAPEWHEIVDIERRVNGIEIKIQKFADLPPEEPLIKIMATGTPEELDRAMAVIPRVWRERYSVVRSAPILLEFLHPMASKGQAVRELAANLDIDRQAVICIGDAGNDVDMITFAGLGAAMGNATTDALAAADIITASNEQDGVAQVINRYILSQN